MLAYEGREGKVSVPGRTKGVKMWVKYEFKTLILFEGLKL